MKTLTSFVLLSLLASNSYCTSLTNRILACDPCPCPPEPLFSVETEFANIGNFSDEIWPTIVEPLYDLVADVIPFLFPPERLVEFKQQSWFKEAEERTCLGGTIVNAVFNVRNRNYTADLRLTSNFTDTGLIINMCSCKQTSSTLGKGKGKNAKRNVDICNEFVPNQIQARLDRGIRIRTFNND